MADGRSLPYSPALDGLRAMALLTIMVYHGGGAVATWLGGGFFSVDVFFMLSGFLITSLLLREHDTSGRIDLAAFWGRRARRLLPALFLLLVGVLAYAALLTGEAAAAVRQDALATLLYASNWWFIISGNSYFEQFEDPSPLTHTWTLAIEEQWYVILPLVAVLLLPRMRSRRAFAALFAGLAGVSALWMALLATTGADPSRMYYGTDTRLQSLLVGAALAGLLTPGVLERLRIPARWLGPLALALLVALMTLATEQSGWIYRGGFLVFAVASALLLASVQAAPDGVTSRLFSLAPLVWVGQLSYGLYLWHWPVYVVLSPARTGMAGTGLLVLRFIVTFALASASYYLVEMPVRRGALSRFPPRQRLAFIAAAPLAVLGLLGVTSANAKPPPPDSLEAIAASSPSPPVANPASPRQPGLTDEVLAVVVGDSVPLSLTAAYTPDLVPGLAVTPAIEFGCGMVPFEAALNSAKMPLRPECATWDEQRADRIAASGATLGVMFAGPWEQYDRWIDGRAVEFTDPAWHDATVEAYRRVLDELAAVTDRQAVVLLFCHGAPSLDLPDATLFQAGRYPGVVNDPARIAAVNDAAREATRLTGGEIQVVDPGPYLCDGGDYRAQIDGVPLHTDGMHFTQQGARLFWKWLGPRLLKDA